MPQKKYYKLERKHFISLYGIRKFWEITPIIGIVGILFSTAGVFFICYYPWTRTDVSYTRTPGYRSIDLDKPRYCKLFDFADYKTYKTNQMLKNLLNEMQCSEWDRFCKCKKDHIEIEYFNQRQLPYTESSCYVEEIKHF